MQRWSETVQQGPSGVKGDPIAAIAEEGGNLGIEIVDVAGHVDGLSSRSKTQAQKFHALRDSALEVLGCDRAISEAARSAGTLARSTGEEVAAKQVLVGEALSDIQALVTDVQTSATRLEELRRSLQEAARTAGTIAGIANHTHILAINATVEAAHAGKSGAGFAIIAREVRELAQQTREASQKVDSSLQALATVAGQLADVSQEGKRKAESVGQRAHAIAGLVAVVASASQRIDGQASAIVSGAKDVEQRIGGFISEVQALDAGVEASSSSLNAVSERLNALMELAERILGMSAATGADTPDRPYVDLAIRTAARVAEIFEQEIASGEATATFFDEKYVRVAHSDPLQVVTRFTAITDRLLPPITEPPLEEPGVVFVVAVDRNGYLPTHNRKFSHPQGSDPEWNKANCRQRRMFDDRVGLAAARSTRPFLIQCYRRDMGGGNFALMKDASVPIFLAGRHWGALRVGYRA